MAPEWQSNENLLEKGEKEGSYFEMHTTIEAFSEKQNAKEMGSMWILEGPIGRLLKKGWNHIGAEEAPFMRKAK